MNREQKLQQSKVLADKGLLEEAWNIVEEVTNENPKDGLAIMMGSYVMDLNKRYGLAYYLAREGVAFEPGRCHTWMQLGRACKAVWQLDECADAFRKAIMLSDTDELRGMNYSNLASAFIEQGRFADAEPICEQALKLNPTHEKSTANYGICKLARGEWSGWKEYSACFGTPMRSRMAIGQEPDWDGTKGATVLVYAEQGIGDEINFASMIPDLKKDSARVVLECDAKLAPLFERSFGCTVYGTRRGGRERWKEIDNHVDYSLPSGELGKFYRTKDEDFPGTGYLKPEPGRALMWRALFDSKRKPCIGIAWTGGIYSTGRKLRRVSLDDLLPVFRAIDAHWVCLQYQDAQAEIEEFRQRHPEIDLVQYPWATLTPDYDDTAALVSELDFVVCMQTAIGHLCGALGKEAHVLIPHRSQWRYGEKGERIIWYNSLRLYRQSKEDSWQSPIDRIAYAIRSRAKKAA